MKDWMAEADRKNKFFFAFQPERNETIFNFYKRLYNQRHLTEKKENEQKHVYPKKKITNREKKTLFGRGGKYDGLVTFFFLFLFNFLGLASGIESDSQVGLNPPRKWNESAVQVGSNPPCKWDRIRRASGIKSAVQVGRIRRASGI